jgi:tRNA A37 threonylcarbamoyladenosine dehydratase
MDLALRDDSFVGFKQLVGADAYARITNASVCVVGLGGVGSWAVEALARSGVGAITLVDLDEVCVTNINRQLHALTSTVGRSKVELLAERVSLINPSCKVTAIKKFFSSSTADEILGQNHSLVLDTIDTVGHKTLLIAECVKRGIRCITVGSAGDRTLPQMATVVDLSKTIHDPLLQIVRKNLRNHHKFPRGERTKFEIPCVYAPKQRGPRDAEPANACDLQEGGQARSRAKSCNAGLGSAVYMTGTIGFMAAAQAIELLSKEPSDVAYVWVERQKARLEEEPA